MRLLAIERQVVSSLYHQLGLVRTLLVLVSIVVEKCHYRPFKALPRSSDESESLARTHVRDALILYRAMERRVGRDAEVVFRAAMSAGAQAFLFSNIGWINLSDYQSMRPRERRSWLEHLIALFPNAIAQVDEASNHRVAFTVTRCRYVELTRTAGYAHLANVFCQGDAAFFESQPVGVEFDRSFSIAEGASHCPFVLTLTEKTSPPHE